MNKFYIIEVLNTERNMFLCKFSYTNKGGSLTWDERSKACVFSSYEFAEAFINTECGYGPDYKIHEAYFISDDSERGWKEVPGDTNRDRELWLLETDNEYELPLN